jgi:hypothetical protein
MRKEIKHRDDLEIKEIWIDFYFDPMMVYCKSEVFIEVLYVDEYWSSISMEEFIKIYNKTKPKTLVSVDESPRVDINYYLNMFKGIDLQ